MTALPHERAVALAGDDLLPRADVVMDRAFTVPAQPDAVWPWFVQLGKDRAGWYLPARIEALLPPRRRALRSIDPAWQVLRVGDMIPDWGGRDATFELARIEAPTTLVYRSSRGRVQLSWAIVLRPAPGEGTRVQLRLRLSGVKRRWLARTGGEFIDRLTVAGLARGLRERTNSLS
ncbi:MAG: hypothetical protein M3O28_15535 [Actinomycetota bacterium]|nr:hypothetical protein [Actinomycetota bacterium]